MPEQYLDGLNPGMMGPQGFDAPMPDPMTMNQPMFQNFKDQQELNGLVSITIDNSEILEDFTTKLRGYRIKKEFDLKTGTVKPKLIKVGRPFCSDDGINEMAGDLQMYLSKGFMLTNIPKNERIVINKMMIIIGHEVSAKLLMNVEEWQVDRTRMSTITTSFITIVWANFMRGFEDGERTKLYPTQKNISMTSTLPHLQQPQKRNIMDM